MWFKSFHAFWAVDCQYLLLQQEGLAPQRTHLGVCSVPFLHCSWPLVLISLCILMHYCELNLLPIHSAEFQRWSKQVKVKDRAWWREIKWKKMKTTCQWQQDVYETALLTTFYFPVRDFVPVLIERSFCFGSCTRTWACYKGVSQRIWDNNVWCLILLVSRLYNLSKYWENFQKCWEARCL